MDKNKLAYLYATALKSPSLLRSLLQEVKLSHFDTNEVEFASLHLILGRMVSVMDIHEALSDWFRLSSFVWNELSSYNDNYREYPLPEDRLSLIRRFFFDEQSGFFTVYCSKVKGDVSDEKIARGYLIQFLMERDVRPFLGRIYNNWFNERDNLSKNIENAHLRVRRIESLLDESVDTIEFQPDSIVRKVIDSGIPWVNNLLVGGYGIGEVYGLLGPYASGKTSLAVQLVVEAAKSEYKLLQRYRSAGIDYVPRKHYIVFYESDSRDIKRRIWSQIAEVDYRSLMSDSSANLSTSKSPKDYEKTLWSKEIEEGTFLGEKERLEFFTSLYSDYIGIIDMGEDKRHIGYVDDIANCLIRHRDMYGYGIGLVVIDYLGAMVNRIYYNRVYQGMRISDHEPRRLQAIAPSRCREVIAYPLNCCVWINHQLSAASQNKSIGRLSHTDSAESKNFAENLSACHIFGNLDSKSFCVVLKQTKSRISSLSSPIVLRLDRLFRRFELAEDLVFDEKTDSITYRTILGVK